MLDLINIGPTKKINGFLLVPSFTSRLTDHLPLYFTIPLKRSLRGYRSFQRCFIVLDQASMTACSDEGSRTMKLAAAWVDEEEHAG